MDDELQRLRKQVEELTELLHLQNQRAADYAGAFMRSKREWVGLTPEEAKEISLANRPYVVDMIAALEAKLKEKNT